MRHYLHILRLVLTASVVALIPLTHAEDIYVAQSAIGMDDGISPATAHSVDFFNTAANWSSPTKIPGKIGPGDTIHLVGTITSPLAVQAGGASDTSRITILFELNAVMTSPAWPNSGAISIYRKDYITIDGGNNGLIEDTDNGTNLGHQVDSYGVRANACNYLTVQNLTIANLYVRPPGTEVLPYGHCISNRADPVSIAHYVVTQCTMHDAFAGINSDYGQGCSDYEFSYNTVYNCNWGGWTGDRSASATLARLRVHHNRFYSFANWDETATNAFHHNGFYGWAENGGSLTDIDCYSNNIGPDYGQHATSDVYFSGNVSNLRVYNNVFFENADDAPTNGLITAGNRTQTGGGDFYIANNTFIGKGSGIAIKTGSGTVTYKIQNNLIMGVGTAIFVGYAANSTIICDHNWTYGVPSTSAYSYSTTGTGSFLTPAQWQARGYDAGMANTDPDLDTDYIPQPTSPLVDFGADLGSIFDDDAKGTLRPQGRAWDIGAYEMPQSISTQPMGVRTRIVPGPMRR